MNTGHGQLDQAGLMKASVARYVHCLEPFSQIIHSYLYKQQKHYTKMSDMNLNTVKSNATVQYWPAVVLLIGVTTIVRKNKPSIKSTCALS